ncbi:hypothetical protein [Paenibacillus sp. sgz500958]|uniref:hypothetical protein n=1 Tax=Paenibacillus sp. sgz500958 TaxID=3242475 RepID=UPI0036D2B6D8
METATAVMFGLPVAVVFRFLQFKPRSQLKSEYKGERYAPTVPNLPFVAYTCNVGEGQ